MYGGLQRFGKSRNISIFCLNNEHKPSLFNMTSIEKSETFILLTVIGSKIGTTRYLTITTAGLFFLPRMRVPPAAMRQIATRRDLRWPSYQRFPNSLSCSTSSDSSLTRRTEFARMSGRAHSTCLRRSYVLHVSLSVQVISSKSLGRCNIARTPRDD